MKTKTKNRKDSTMRILTVLGVVSGLVAGSYSIMDHFVTTNQYQESNKRIDANLADIKQSVRDLQKAFERYEATHR
jgi:hypothetical protein